LTLNTDLADRELGQAARILELAQRVGVEAVLVRDPALLAFKHHYPKLEFHFSTQTCMANSADVAAAEQLGARRVVLAREMTLAEIAAASAVAGVETEVFAQGALCFCVSGRCLLSSWVGSRSGNRGTCTSPCRVPWSIDDRPAGTPLSMRDLATVHRLDDLARAGVSGLKIEGRLKTAAWVRQAVSLYRRALDGQPAEGLLEETASLGDYTGRLLTCGYLDGRRDELTGLAGRAPADGRVSDADDSSRSPSETAPTDHDIAAEEDRPGYELDITIADRAIECVCRCGGQEARGKMPKTVVHRPHKAVPVEQLLERLAGEPLQGFVLGRSAANMPEYLLVPRAANAIVDHVHGFVRRVRKAPDELVRIELPAEVQVSIRPAGSHPANRLSLGQPADRVRLEAGAAAAFFRQVRPPEAIIEGLTEGGVGRLQAACGDLRIVAALPAVFFEDEIPAVRRLLAACAAAGLTVEVNSWGGWHLAREAATRMEGGPGLAVLNSLAARMLLEAGMECVTLSSEADRRQLEQISAHCPAPCSLTVFGRPPLMVTRVRLPEEWLGRVFADRRGVQMVPRQHRGLGVFRPVEPFDLRGVENPRVQAAHLVVDLVGAEDPVGDWRAAPLPGERDRAFHFNYDRTLA